MIIDDESFTANWFVFFMTGSAITLLYQNIRHVHEQAKTGKKPL